MCGIAGLALNKPGTLNWAGRALEGLRHRGPDDRGWLVWSPTGAARRGKAWDEAPGSVLLVHRRLSILDLSELGWQPMSSPDGRYHLVFNGEIYNYLELRQELEALGHCFRSHSDTEVLLMAWAHWGTACLQRLVGMFAFAVLDTEEQSLHLVRDFLASSRCTTALLPGVWALPRKSRSCWSCRGWDGRCTPRACTAICALA